MRARAVSPSKEALIGGISIALGYKTRWGAWLIVAFLVPVTFMMHAYWRLHDPASVHIQSAMFWKNAHLPPLSGNRALSDPIAINREGGDDSSFKEQGV
jgi:hypothetical protein